MLSIKTIERSRTEPFYYSNHFNNQQRAELASDGTEAANESDKTTPVAMETSHPVASQLWVDEFRPVKYTGVLSLNATYLVYADAAL